MTKEYFIMGNILIMDDNNVTGLTPYHTYMTINRFETILEDIERGIIPTNTGQIFPVTFDDDFKDDTEQESLFDLRPQRDINSIY